MCVVHVSKGQKLSVILSSLSTLICKAWGFPVWLVSLASLLWGAYFCDLRGLNYRCATLPSQHLCEFWESKLWSSFL